MNDTLRTLIISITAILLFSCKQNPNDHIDEGKIVGSTYTSEDIGWTIVTPTDWEVISKDDMNSNYDRGKKAVEEVAGEIDISELKTLISFQKDAMNNFQSSSQYFEETYEGEWEENNQLAKEIIYDAMAGQGIRADTSSSKTTIDGLEFDVFKSVIYAPDGSVIIQQELYSRFINGFDFGMTITYSNEKDRKTMIKAMKSSKFKFRG